MVGIVVVVKMVLVVVIVVGGDGWSLRLVGCDDGCHGGGHGCGGWGVVVAVGRL